MKRLAYLGIAIFLFLTAVAIIYIYGTTSSYEAVRSTPTNTRMPSILGIYELFGLTIISMVALAIGFLFWIGTLVHMLKNGAIQGTDKIVWTLIIIFLHVLGALVYVFMAPKKLSRHLPSA